MKKIWHFIFIFSFSCFLSLFSFLFFSFSFLSFLGGLFQGQLRDMNVVSIEQEIVSKLRIIVEVIFFSFSLPRPPPSPLSQLLSPFFSFSLLFLSFSQEHTAHCKKIQEAIDLYSNYQKSYHNLSFKPSTYKTDEVLCFIPTNLHHQKMKVYPRGDPQLVERYFFSFLFFFLFSFLFFFSFFFSFLFLFSLSTHSYKHKHKHKYRMRLGRLDGKVRKRAESKVGDKEEEETEGEYHVTSFGAPAAHVLRFKGGGLYHLQVI